MKWYKITGVENTGEPFVKQVKAGDKNVCLVSQDGEVFAFGLYCPHAGGNLGYGWCNNGKLVCPIHRYSYDLQTGKGSEGQNDYFDTFPVKVEGSDIYVGVYSFFERIKQGFNT